MPLHLTRVAFGCSSLAVLESRLHVADHEARLTTRYRPKQADEVIGGSLYWIIGHQLVARSPILRFDDAEAGRTHIVVEPRCIAVVPRPRRAHQGWRYLHEQDAPPDLTASQPNDAAMPESLRQELAILGLL
ncbi:DUF1489 domain-containing protein [Sphingomonas lacunae]|uniref:DUF1489 domain-containing protein n=1 Tax=Sphingomonas lacunae TaxID=2698828 RepID=A0A6M4ARS7_9SPHN|nr:DUF1489 domain-containing protein [Sphingomonas lacunae]QJQ31788.1 DUF1489 domain-containing protein [Sphingomonas lacunae]